ncbi:hypothetical protein ATY41_03710 [Leifsonia xyli subsp. xyli]|uniref:Uncharacterized protein n=1 Tax=Leifsonia xyli subsp. xyli TaxID=59736 RepID=A0A1E2SIU3_LEIXY|nr:hypothetical protein ATY41_03710 [Leifsonia xyli subsp. xyli]
MSDKTRDAAHRAADEIGSVASSSASGRASGRTLALGVLVPSVSRWFYTQVLEGLDTVFVRTFATPRTSFCNRDWMMPRTRSSRV